MILNFVRNVEKNNSSFFIYIFFNIYLSSVINIKFIIIFSEFIWMIGFEFTVFLTIFNIVKKISLHDGMVLFDTNVSRYN